jgi:hypothetical protein
MKRELGMSLTAHPIIRLIVVDSVTATENLLEHFMYILHPLQRQHPLLHPLPLPVAHATAIVQFTLREIGSMA